MIELAPYHKIGLPVENPVLLAAGTIGYGEAVPRGLDLSRLGAVVVGPVMRHGTAGSGPPRYAPVAGGMVLESGRQNRGVGKVLKRFGRLWSGLGCPVVVQIADSQSDLVGSVARRLHEVEGVSGLELLLPDHGDPALVSELVRAAVRAGDLPVWVKLPPANAATAAARAVDAGATALVIGQPPSGAASRPANCAASAPAVVRGSLYGPLTHALMLDTLLNIATLNLPCALIACGGIHTEAQARQALDSDAAAVQIDSAVWVEPALPAQLAAGLG